MDERMIEVRGLEKSYGSVRAVRGIDFYVERGKLFAFLGPNGAGKSTTIDMICTLLSADAGEVRIDGHVLGQEDDAIRRKIGVVFQNGMLDELLTVRENLMLRAAFYYKDRGALKMAVSNAARVADTMEFWNRAYGKLSGGQRRRADIARALLHTPKVLFLDEPTTGLDPQTRQSVWKTIRSLQQETGMTIFLTTHYMEEAADSDYVIVIDDGQIAARGTPASLREKYAADTLRMMPSDRDAVIHALAAQETAYETAGQEILVRLPSTMDALTILAQVRDDLEGFEVTRGSMDDAFIGITGKELRE